MTRRDRHGRPGDAEGRPGVAAAPRPGAPRRTQAPRAAAGQEAAGEAAHVEARHAVARQLGLAAAGVGHPDLEPAGALAAGVGGMRLV